MKEHPIIFQADMVRATLDLLKTVTRRTWGLEKINKHPDDWILLKPIEDNPLVWYFKNTSGYTIGIKCPYGQIKDKLWVKETWFASPAQNGMRPSEIPQYLPIWYPATDKPIINHEWNPKIRSSMFMCRWMSRILLEITGLRAERLQEITLQDIWAEGCQTKNMTVLYFKDLWDSLNARRGYSFESNPWVWPISFRQL